MSPAQTRVFPWPRLHEFCAAVFRHVGLPGEEAALSADVLSSADRRGIDSHGVARLRTYYDLLANGRINPRPRPRVVRETASTATVENISLRCRRHNQYEAELVFGPRMTSKVRTTSGSRKPTPDVMFP